MDEDFVAIVVHQLEQPPQYRQVVVCQHQVRVA
jgi:hypothetical protein